MWIKLDIDGITMYFKIGGYCKPGEDPYHEGWCDVQLTLQGQGIDLDIAGCSLFYDEIDEILSSFENLIQGNITEAIDLGFMEPDFRIELNPGNKENECAYRREDWKCNDIHANFRIFYGMEYLHTATFHFV